MTTYTLAEQIAEVEREIKVRERNYARWILKGKISATSAERQTGCLRAVLETLNRALTELPDRAPGKLVTGAVLGPAKAREVERAKILGALSTLIDERAMYLLVAKLQNMGAGQTNEKAR